MPPPKAELAIRTAAIGERTCTVNALSLHVVLAKWKGVVLLVMPPELREPHTTEVEGTRCKSSRLYWTVTSLFAVELVKVRLIVVGFPPIQSDSRPASSPRRNQVEAPTNGQEIRR